MDTDEWSISIEIADRDAIVVTSKYSWVNRRNSFWYPSTLNLIQIVVLYLVCSLFAPVHKIEIGTANILSENGIVWL